MKKMKNKKSAVIVLVVAQLIINSMFAQLAWTQKASLTGGIRFGGVGFAIGSKGYIGTGVIAAGATNDFWEYDATSNTWTQKADVGGPARFQGVGFSCNGKGYVGTGDDASNNLLNDFWEYNQTSNTWAAKANFPGGQRDGAVGFAIGTKGYVGTGGDTASNVFNDFYEYNPVSNAWTQKANFIGGARFYASSFSLGTKGYVGTGEGAMGTTSDFYEYNPATNMWTSIASCDGNISNPERMGASAWAIGNKGYITFGENNNLNRATNGHQDTWEYDPTNNSWTSKDDYPGLYRSQGIGFSMNGKGYAGTGIDTAGFENDFYEFNPLYCSTVATVPVITGPNVVCGILHPVYVAISTGSNSYQWIVPSGMTIQSGQGTGSITTTVAGGTLIGNVTCTAINACGSSVVGTYMVTKKPAPTSAIAGPTSICGAATATYTTPLVFGATSYTWIMPTGLTIISGQGTTTMTVSVAATFTSGNIKVVAVNACGSVPGATLNVWGKVPVIPSVISGLASVCGVSSASYSISLSLATATNYSWTVPAGMSIVSGQGTTTINVSFSGFSSGTLSVIQSNPCGNSPARTLAINSLPALPGIITATPAAPFCLNQTGIDIQVSPVSGAIAYVWTFPTGVVTTTDLGNERIINWGAVAGNISVKAVNACATGNARTMSVALTTCLAANNLHLSDNKSLENNQTEFNFNIYPSPAHNDFTVETEGSVENNILFEIYNNVGERIKQLSITENKTVVSIAGLSKGIYFIRIFDNDTHQVYKQTMMKE